MQQQFSEVSSSSIENLEGSTETVMDSWILHTLDWSQNASSCVIVVDEVKDQEKMIEDPKTRHVAHDVCRDYPSIPHYLEDKIITSLLYTFTEYHANHWILNYYTLKKDPIMYSVLIIKTIDQYSPTMSDTEHSWKLCSGVLNLASLRVSVHCVFIWWCGL